MKRHGLCLPYIHIILQLLVTCSFWACKKENNNIPPPDPFPNNELKATVSIEGGTPYLLEAKGKDLLIAKNKNTNSGETAITIYGGNANGHLQLDLVNITTPGTYPFSRPAGLQSYALSMFIVGNVLTGPFTSFLNPSPFPGSFITIDSISNNFVKGTFAANLGAADTLRRVQCTNGSFRGNF
jgi:hypothetical protein